MKWSDTVDESARFIEANNGGANNFIYSRPSSGGKILFAAARPSVTTLTTNGSNFNDGNWHHVLFRVDCSTGDADIYIDNDNSSNGASSAGFSGTLEHPDGTLKLIDVNANFSEYIITDGFDSPTDFADFSGPNPCPIPPKVSTIMHYRAEFAYESLVSPPDIIVPDQSGNSYDAVFENSTFASAITTTIPC